MTRSYSVHWRRGGDTASRYHRPHRPIGGIAATTAAASAVDAGAPAAPLADAAGKTPLPSPLSPQVPLPIPPLHHCSAPARWYLSYERRTAVAPGNIFRIAANSRGEEDLMSSRGVVVAGVEVEAPLTLRLRLVFPVAVAEARHHERLGETGCTPL